MRDDKMIFDTVKEIDSWYKMNNFVIEKKI